MADYSEAALEAFNNAEESPPWVHTLEFIHSEFLQDGVNVPIRIALSEFDVDCYVDGEGVVSFTAMQMKVTQPKIESGVTPQIQMVIANAGVQMTKYLQNAVNSIEPIKCKYRQYLETTRLNTVEIDYPVPFVLSDISVNSATITATAKADNPLGRKFPSLLQTTEMIPTLA